MLIKSKKHVRLVELVLQLDQVQKIKVVDIQLEQIKRNLEIIALGSMINYKIPAHCKKDF